MSENQFAEIEIAIQDIRQGRMVILVDDEKRENEGDLVIAADKITPEAINFMSKNGRGLICLTLSSDDVHRLQLPLMVAHNRSHFNTAFTVSIGAAEGITTGISAADRALTVQKAIDPNSTPDDVVTPGHIFPLRAQDGGVLTRPGHTEGSVDLAKLAGLRPGAVICEIMKDDGSMARRDDLLRFGKEHGLSVVTITDLISYRVQQEKLVQMMATANMPIHGLGEFQLTVFKNTFDQAEHIALIKGEINIDKPSLVRIHSECLTGDVFASKRCDCGNQLQMALEEISKHGGILLYMREEGRGIGLTNKIKAYALQDQGKDTVEANQALGFSADQRYYGVSAQILRKLGVKQVRLMTNNPDKINSLEQYGISVAERVAVQAAPTKENISYLNTKKEKLGHLL